MFIRSRKEVHCNTIEEFNEQLKIAKSICTAIFYQKYDRSTPICERAYFETTDKYYKLTYKLGNEKRTYVVDKNGEEYYEPDTIHIASEINKVYKVQKVSEYLPDIQYDNTPYQKGKVGYRNTIGSASPIRDSNKQYRGKSTEAIEYDLSSAYGQFLAKPLPDLRTVKRNAKINKGQVGFMRYGSTSRGFARLRLFTEVGTECDYVFDLMESPYKDWVKSIFEQLATETNEREQRKLKDKFRISVGLFQDKNPFWRCMIVEQCNDLIKGLLRDTSIYWSTDSIVSAVERKDILETDYTWKIKHQGTFKLKDRTTHQWNTETPKINGIGKLAVKYYNETHDVKFDILTDKIPEETGSIYVLNKNTFRLEINKECEHYLK